VIGRRYTTSKLWSLTSGDGTKYVYVRYKDWLGRVSTSYSDSIILDTTPPSITGVTGDTIGTTGETVTITATISDTNFDYARLYYTPIDSNETYLELKKGYNSVSIYCDPYKVGDITYYIIAYDKAGNSTRSPTTGVYKITVIDNDPPIVKI
jgi:hypothetical protein